MDKKHLVIVAVYFPPIISIASQRIHAFARYFDKQRFRITLITLDAGEPYEVPGYLREVTIIRFRNDHLLKQVNLRKNHPYLVHKAGAALNKALDLVVMDEYAGWTASVSGKLREIAGKEGIDLILSSFAPVAAHLSVLRSGLPDSGVRWIADMRDEMSLNPFYSRIKRNFFSRIEKRIFDRAWMVTTTSDEFLVNFKKLGSDYPVKFIQIKNGFDFDPPHEYDFNPVFTVTHAGTFYGDIKPHTFFRAVKELLDSGQIPDIRINLIGAGNAFIVPSEISGHIHQTGRIRHEEAVDYMIRADANVIIMPPKKKGTLPGKMYEYLGVLKPILALMDDTEQAAAIIRRSGAGFVAGFHDIAAIKEIIMKVYALWAAKGRLQVDTEYIGQFRRSHQVKILQDLILGPEKDPS